MVISIHREPRGFVVDAANVGWGGSNAMMVSTFTESSLAGLYSSQTTFLCSCNARTNISLYQIKYECTGHLELQKPLMKENFFFFEDDDEYILDLAVAKNYGIITNDTFEDTYNNGEPVERQRSKYLTRIGQRIDELTWGTGRMGTEFARMRIGWSLVQTFYLRNSNL